MGNQCLRLGLFIVGISPHRSAMGALRNPLRIIEDCQCLGPHAEPRDFDAMRSQPSANRPIYGVRTADMRNDEIGEFHASALLPWTPVYAAFGRFFRAIIAW